MMTKEMMEAGAAEFILDLFNAVLVKYEDLEKPVVYAQVENTTVFYPISHTNDTNVFRGTLNRYARKRYVSLAQQNKTFYNNWGTMMNTPDHVRIVQQVIHYITVYLKDEGVTDTVYVPRDTIPTVPNLEHLFQEDLCVYIIKMYTREEIISKCLEMLTSGAALKSETVEALVHILYTYKHKFTNEVIRNKEAAILVAHKFNYYGNMPPQEFMRYLIYLTTGTTLLIQSKDVLKAVAKSDTMPSAIVNAIKFYGYRRLAPIYNRYKNLFLTLKSLDKKDNSGINNPLASALRKVNVTKKDAHTLTTAINKISKMSKKLHKPMDVNPLMVATSQRIHSRPNWKFFVQNAPIFQLYRVIKELSTSLHLTNNYDTLAKVYPIRNGKSWTAEKPKKSVDQFIHLKENLGLLLQEVKKRKTVEDITVYVPENVNYEIPLSEKSFVGNIPYGTTFNLKDNPIVGIYWENTPTGRIDLDLSLTTKNFRLGWNEGWHYNDSLMYSGDVTDAPHGAAEYFLINKDTEAPDDTVYMLSVNQYSRTVDFESCKLIIGTKQGNISDWQNDCINSFAGLDYETRDHFTAPDSLVSILEVPIGKSEKQTELGSIYKYKGNFVFKVEPIASVTSKISRNTDLAKIQNMYFAQRKDISPQYVELLAFLGYKVTRNANHRANVDIDLSPEALERNTLMDLING